MFALKKEKSRVEGLCLAARCKAPNTGDSPFCARHFNEWQAAGAPDLNTLEAPAKKEPGNEIVEAKAEVVQMRDYLGQYLASAATIPLASQAELDWLGQVRETARLALAHLEERRTAITKPMMQAKREVDALFAPAKEQCEALLSTCTQRLNEHARQLKAAQDAALAQVDAGARDDATLAIAHGGLPQLPEQVRTQRVFRFEVLDMAQVPQAFLTVDTDAVMAYVRAKAGQCEIPGLRIWSEDEVRTA